LMTPCGLMCCAARCLSMHLGNHLPMIAGVRSGSSCVLRRRNWREQFASQNPLVSVSADVTASGCWLMRPCSPGTLVEPSDTSSNRDLLVDDDLHSPDTNLLSKLGVSDCPEGMVDVSAFGQLDEWLKHWRSHYGSNVNGRASWSYLEPAGLSCQEVGSSCHN